MKSDIVRIVRDRCPGCGRKNIDNKKLMERDFRSCASIVAFRYYSVFLCITCSLVYAGDIEESMSLDLYYQKLSRYEGDNFVISPKLASHYEFVASAVTSHIEKKARILDVGCAFGGLLHEFDKRGYGNVFGLEPSEKNCEYAMKEYGIKVCQGQLGGESEFSKETFEVLLLNGVLEHLINIKERIEDCKSLLGENGLLVLTVPDLSMFKEHNDLYQEFSAEHINYFNINSLGFIMRQEDFVLEDYRQDHTSLMGLAGNMVTIWRRGSEEKKGYSWSKTDSIKDLEVYLNACNEYRKRINQRISTYDLEGGYYVWGAGTNTAMLIQLGILKIERIKGVFDSNKHYQGCDAYGNIIEDPGCLRNKEILPIVISSQYAFRAIKTEIEKMELKNDIVDLFS